MDLADFFCAQTISTVYSKNKLKTSAFFLLRLRQRCGRYRSNIRQLPPVRNNNKTAVRIVRRKCHSSNKTQQGRWNSGWLHKMVDKIDGTELEDKFTQCLTMFITSTIRALISICHQAMKRRRSGNTYDSYMPTPELATRT